ncbi:MAG: low affinity iron permease family protein [Microvirga sp.]
MWLSKTFTDIATHVAHASGRPFTFVAAILIILAIQVKLDELIRTSAAQNLYIGIERLTEEELEEIRKRCEERAKGFMAEKAAKAADEAQDNANRKAAAAVKRAVS